MFMLLFGFVVLVCSDLLFCCYRFWFVLWLRLWFGDCCIICMFGWMLDCVSGGLCGHG